MLAVKLNHDMKSNKKRKSRSKKRSMAKNNSRTHLNREISEFNSDSFLDK